ncbi:MAG TPA: hypothetical protein PK530_24575 [Anaerolineales bacterium]|nr:hypothetical protein [Anaerolineales bacterium]
MFTLTDALPPRGAYFLTAPPVALYMLMAFYAGQGEVFVLDGGNRFNAYQVARAMRAQTVHLYTWQARLHVARAFTCHEMTALLTRMPGSAAPIFVLDFLATFSDEAVTEAEAGWLLHRGLEAIQRLQKTAPVFITGTPPVGAERTHLAASLQRMLSPLFLESLMGKTTPTTADLIREMEAILARFRQLLPVSQRVHLDALIVKAKKHTTAISQANHLLPFETIELAMLLEQECAQAELGARLAALEKKVSHLENERPPRP